MMIDNKVPPNMRVIDETLLYPICPSGLLENQNAIVRYRHPDIKEPVLRLADYIYDYNGNYIAPGMYELALSDDKEFLLLIESHKLLAVIPVFKLAENEKKGLDNTYQVRSSIRMEINLKAVQYLDDAADSPDPRFKLGDIVLYNFKDNVKCYDVNEVNCMKAYILM